MDGKCLFTTHSMVAPKNPCVCFKAQLDMTSSKAAVYQFIVNGVQTFPICLPKTFIHDFLGLMVLQTGTDRALNY